MTNDDMIDVCPECDGSSLRLRVTGECEHRYLCKDCGGTFDDPNQRPPKSNGVSADALLERIVDDPDELREATGL